MELTVVAIARDAGAVQVGEASRVVHLAPLERTAATVPTPRPRLGEDGVLGSRGVDLSWRPAPFARDGAVRDGWPRPNAGGLAAQLYR